MNDNIKRVREGLRTAAAHSEVSALQGRCWLRRLCDWHCGWLAPAGTAEATAAAEAEATAGREKAQRSN